MKKPLVVLALAALIGLCNSRAQAQNVVVANAVPTSPGIIYGTYFNSPRFTYSYYASYQYPAREYVGYGTNDFPYYGRPYGHPSDRWSWPYLTNSYSNALTRYYYPILK